MRFQLLSQGSGHKETTLFRTLFSGLKHYGIYIVILGLGLCLAVSVHVKYQQDVHVAQGHYQQEMHDEAAVVASDLERVLRSMYQGLRTIALLPGVRGIDRYAAKFDPDARQTTQELYNNLASNVAMSEVYIVPLDMEPDRMDPHTHRLQEPITTFDELIVGRNADQGRGKREASEDGEKVPEIEIYEYRLMKRQMAWFREHYPREENISGLKYPALCGPEVITCDNSRYSPSRPDDKDRSGLVYSVPFYGRDGRLKGCISGVILTHVFRDLLPAGGYTLMNRKEKYLATPHEAGVWSSSRSWIERGLADPNLLYSELIPLSVNDMQGEWKIWAGQPDTLFWSRGTVRSARRFAQLSYLGCFALVLGSETLVLIFRRHQRALQAKNQELEQRVQERTADLRIANARLEALATTDPLTNLPNHRALVAALDQEIERSHRFHRPCALLFLDIDYFKAINDSYGHAAGDVVLQEFSKLARQCLRGMDTVGRWGGEEFVVILPETDRTAALEAAERFRAAVAGHTFPVGGGIHLTCSLGVSVYPHDAFHRADLAASADRAMYAAKRLGRNQARAASDPALALLDTEATTSREEVALQGTVEALARLVAARDNYTSDHMEVVADLAMQVALKLGLSVPEARMVGLTGRLHDVGKVAISDAILRKPGPFLPEEWQAMKRHPVIGAEVVDQVPGLRGIAPGIRGHHERWDGTGYPDGLSGEAIPLGARIVAVANAYSAMTTDRPYRNAMDPAWALEELHRHAGTQFDRQVVEAMEVVLKERNQSSGLRAA